MVKKISLLVLAFAFFTAFQVQAQTITGRVTSKEDPMGIPGVAVQIKNTTIGTTTDIDGKYSLSVPQGKTVVFTSTGMKPQEIVVGSQTTIDVLMEPSLTALEGVTVSGYGVSRKQGAGTSTNVASDAIKRQTEANVANSLQGAVPGLQVSAASGSPGGASTVKLRGTSSMGLSSSQPLYIIDGVPVAAGNFGSRSTTTTDPLSSINPDDIETMTVLKDASATSIYGARASNGVILITTKRGKEGASNLQLNAKIGVATTPYIPRKWRMIDADDYITLMTEGYMNSHKNTDFNKAYAALAKQNYWDKDINKVAKTDWWDEVTQTGLVQDYNLSASGGNEKSTYYLSLGYFNEEGIVIGEGYERYSARLNLDQKIRDYISIGLNMTGTYANQQMSNGGLAYSNPTFLARSSRPTAPVKNADGTWNTDDATSPSFAMKGYNAVALKQDPDYPDEYYNVQYKAILSPYIMVNIMKNLVFKTKLGVDFTAINEKQSWSSVVNPDGKKYKGYASRYDFTRGSIIFTNTLNWMPKIGDDKTHHINVMAGQEAQKISDYDAFMTGTDFTTPSITELSSAAISNANTSLSYATLSSYFTSVEYDFRSKYYLSGSLRYDGSSRIGEENQWGLFYALAAKYRISEEEFMSFSKKWLSNLSLRLSYGTTGNQEIGWYQARATYDVTSSYNEAPAMTPGYPGAPELKWESKNKLNFGLEATILDFINIELDIYNEYTKNNLANLPISMTTGNETMVYNVGEMQNYGIEFQVNATLIDAKSFNWNVNANISANKNKIKKLPTEDAYMTGNIGWKEEGRSWNTLILREDAGLDNNGLIVFWDSNGNKTSDKTKARFKIIETDPLFYGGFGTSFNWKNFDLGINFFYNVGSKYFSNDAYYYEVAQANDGSPTDYYYFDNRGSKTPIFIYGNTSTSNSSVMNSTRYIMNGSYLRLKSINLGYTLPKELVQKWTLSKVRVYFSADNLYTFTHKDFRGFDPDAGLSAAQAGLTPIPRHFTLGASILF